MTSELFDLDIMNPRGWGELGQDGDACEHGHQVTEIDLENLKKHYGLEILHHTINGNQYKFISLLHKDATDTIVSILGGDGKYYVINSKDIPNGLIMPFFEYCKKNKLNLIIIDPNTPQEHAWPYWIGVLHQSKTKKIVSHFLIQSKKHPFSQILENTLSIKKNSRDKVIEKLCTDKKLLIRYIKDPQTLRKMLFSFNISFNKTLSNIHIFIKDFKNILEYIKNLTNTELWLMGHCSSTVMISIIYDINQYNHLYKGMIFLNPWWKKNWKEKGLEEMNYFSTKVTKPLLIVQHSEDPCIGTHPEICKKILSDIDNSLTKYVELDGGIDQGCPHFSLGYHGFRGIEGKVIDEINKFIQDYGKI